MEQKYYTDIVAGLAERTIKRLWVIILVLVILLFGSNAAWLIYEGQFEGISVEQEVDTGDGDAFVVGVGDVDYGESKADS